MRILLIFFLIISLQSAAQITSEVFTEKYPEINPVDSFEYYIDPTNQRQLQEIKYNSSFTLQKGIYHSPPADATVWIKLYFTNATHKKWFLEVNAPHIDEVVLYKINPTSMSVDSSTLKQQFNTRNIKVNQHI